MRIAHFAIEFRLRHQRGHGVDNQHIDCTGADEGLSDLQCLFAVVRLRYQKVIHIHAQLFGILRIERVFSIDKRRHPARLLRFSDDLQRDGGFARRFRAKNFNHPAARNTTHAESGVERDGSGGYHRDGHDRLFVAEAHDGALTELLFNLC